MGIFNWSILALILLIFQFNGIAQSGHLAEILIGKDSIVDQVLVEYEKFEVQLLYSQIDRDENQKPIFKQYSLGLDDKRYFYPASTVKLPIAIQSLEKVNELGIIGLTKESTMKTGAMSIPQTERFKDSTSMDSLPSIAHDIHKIFLFSENDAYNRLFEFLGANRINNGLKKIGINNTRIIHRVGALDFDPESNRLINPVSFYSKDKLLYHQGGASSTFLPEFKLDGEKKGVGYYSNGKLIPEHKDFSNKNFISLENLQSALSRVIFPFSYPRDKRFLLTKKDRNFLIKSMGTLPSESYIKSLNYPDGYVKFFMFGGAEKEIPDHIKIMNKVGDAYGYLIDIAYVVDLKNNVEFMISGVIHVNENKIFNDDQYQYESIGLPFLKAVGEIIYNHELERKRKITPDFSYYKKLFNWSEN